MVQQRIDLQHQEAPFQLKKTLSFQKSKINYWALCISIIAFVFISMMLAGAALNAYYMGFVSSAIYGTGPILISAAYIFVSVLLFFPAYYLFQFSLGKKSFKREVSSSS